MIPLKAAFAPKIQETHLQWLWTPTAHENPGLSVLLRTVLCPGFHTWMPPWKSYSVSLRAGLFISDRGVMTTTLELCKVYQKQSIRSLIASGSNFCRNVNSYDMLFCVYLTPFLCFRIKSIYKGVYMQGEMVNNVVKVYPHTCMCFKNSEACNILFSVAVAVQ